MRKEERMKVLVKLFTLLFIISGLTLLSCGEKGERAEAGEMFSPRGNSPETEVKIPWDDYGYKKLTQFHLRYYYIFEDAVDKVLRGEMSWDEAKQAIAESCRYEEFTSENKKPIDQSSAISRMMGGHASGAGFTRMTKFEEPRLVYKALLVETTVSLDVFENF